MNCKHRHATDYDSICPRCVAEMVQILVDVREDSVMALNGQWDPGDLGYLEVQIDRLTGFLNRIGYEPEEDSDVE
jgi:hypothetical protein